MPLQTAGAVLVAAGASVLVLAFVRFVREGRGTPAPLAPPRRLVVGGPYRYVRNPMYLAVLAVVGGEALILARPVMLLYEGILWVVFVSYVALVEEPKLRRRFGASYAGYRRDVRAWIPRLRPWIGK